MFALLKLIQSLLGALHSEGTPGQLAAGICLGSVLGLTPLLNLHNAIVFAALVLLNVSFAGGMLGWALFAPSLTSWWTSLYNMPIVPLTNFNNTVVLGSLVFALLLFVPLFLVTRWAVTRYRATVGERVRQSKWYRAVTASKAYNVYRMLRP